VGTIDVLREACKTMEVQLTTKELHTYRMLVLRVIGLRLEDFDIQATGVSATKALIPITLAAGTMTLLMVRMSSKQKEPIFTAS
jgi:hypothetical protein